MPFYFEELRVMVTEVVPLTPCRQTSYLPRAKSETYLLIKLVDPKKKKISVMVVIVVSVAKIGSECSEGYSMP